ncbi:hypothetical protein [Microbacterium halotolerans]|nr:hypothetical protein [Microbacterium halotolerans]
MSSAPVIEVDDPLTVTRMLTTGPFEPVPALPALVALTLGIRIDGLG